MPIAIVLATVAVAAFLDDHPWTLWVFGGTQAIAAVLAGWLVARHGYSIWKCAIAGVLLIVIDHVVVKTFAFALTFQWLAIGGVLISFAMLAFVPMALAAAAGFVATRLPPSNPTVETDAHEAARGSP
jgi:MFS family permease